MYYYQYIDGELVKSHGLIKPFESRGKEVYLLFNNLSMFEDDLRFMSYLKKGDGESSFSDG